MNDIRFLLALCAVLAVVFVGFIFSLDRLEDRPIPAASCEPVGEAIADLTASHNALIASQTQWYEHIEGEILRHEKWLSANDRRIESANSGHANILSAISSSEQRVMEELENWRNEQ